MFGFGNKDKGVDVRLTRKQLEELQKNMSRAEKKEFERKQRQAEAERDWNAMCYGELFRDE